MQLFTNQNQVEQNQAVTLSASVFNKFGNPLPNIEVSLYLSHPDYGGELLVDHKTTNVRGTAIFETTLRSVGYYTLVTRIGVLASPQINILVSPSSLASSGPRSWNGVVGSLSRLEVDLNTVSGKMIATNKHPTKEDLCASLGLDYSNANDRDRVSNAIHNMKGRFDHLWRVLYEPSSAYGKNFATFMKDENSFSAWKTDPDSPYSDLRATYHLTEDEIRELWVLSAMWDVFVQIANKYNLHLLVAYKDGGIWRYKQPNFWEYDQKQILLASHLFKGIQTILSRHRDLGMVLTSGQSVHKALESTSMISKMITDQTPQRFRCPMCWRVGAVVEFLTTEDYFAHIKSSH